MGTSPACLIAGVVLLAGCAGPAMLPAPSDAPQDRLAGHLYLRVDRFLASFADQAG